MIHDKVSDALKDVKRAVDDVEQAIDQDCLATKTRCSCARFWSRPLRSGTIGAG